MPKENKKMRVVAYCRVSTFGLAQLHSLDTQIEAYTRIIKNNKDWRFAGAFYDVESGLRRKGITELDKMLKKADHKMLKNKKYKGDTMLQKTITEDFMRGKKIKNTGQRNRYYIKDSHPAIVSAEVFAKVQEEMAKCTRYVSNEDGTLETSGSKYILGNLLACGDCGMPYWRRTERVKVVWRCATRIEKGRQACSNSPTLN